MTPRATALLVLVLASTAIAAVITSVIIRLARTRGWLDIPNHRSSHTSPTPRGGGLSVVLVTLATELCARGLGYLELRQFLALFVGGGLVAGIGALDDIRNVSVRWRLTIQFAAAALAVAALTAPSALSFATIRLPLAGVGGAVAVVAVVWMTNLYNFMDGTDGIAGLQGLVAALSAATIFALANQRALSCVSIALAGALVGFLMFNWAPARVFMGDVCSGFLGFTFAVMAIAGDVPDGVSVVWILLPLSPFIVDATVVLLKRTLNGAQPGTAHRDHAYQRLSDAYSHSTVALCFGLWAILLSALSIVGYVKPMHAWHILGVSEALSVVAYILIRSRAHKQASF